MKCPIKKLEDDCIESECPYWKSGYRRCGLAIATEDLGDIAEALSWIGSVNT